jgi:predicted amino acid racemase
LREAARRIADGGRIVQISTGGTTSPTLLSELERLHQAAIDVGEAILAGEVGNA